MRSFIKCFKNIIELGIIIAIATFFNSCRSKPCTPDPDTYHLLDSIALSKVPYKNYQNLTFINVSTNDTHVFYANKWDSALSYSKDYSEECRGGVYTEIRELKFVAPTYTYPIYVSIVGTSGSGTLYIDLLKYKFYDYIWNITLPNADSLTIQKKSYKDVIYIKNKSHPTKYGCYYSLSSGIIKIESLEGNLELIK